MFKKSLVIPVVAASALAISSISIGDFQASAKVPATKSVNYKTPLNDVAAHFYSLYQQPASADIVTVLARSNYGVNKNYYTTYYDTIVKELKANKGVSTESTGAFAKKIIALNAIGKNPKAVAGYNLIDLLGDKYLASTPYVTDTIYVLLALEGKNTDFSNKAKYKGIMKKQLVQKLVATQFDNGGFSWDQNAAAGVSVDMTAMALAALVNFDEDATVKASIRHALDYMASQLTSVAGYAPYGGNSADTQAQVIVGLTENGINPKTARSFIKNGHWALSNLLLNYDKANSAFNLLPNDKTVNTYTTYSGLLGLVAYDRYAKNQATYYDMENVKATSLSYDTTAPKTVKVSALTNVAKTISGTAEAYAKVDIYNGKKRLKTIKTTKSGKFSYTLTSALKAKSTISIYVTDLAGNKSKAISYKVADRLTPAKPKVAAIKKNAKKVIGTTTKGATVYVKVGKKTYKATANKTTGKFSVKTPKLTAKTKVSVSAKKAGYTSKTTTMTVMSK